MLGAGSGAQGRTGVFPAPLRSEGHILRAELCAAGRPLGKTTRRLPLLLVYTHGMCSFFFRASEYCSCAMKV